MSTPTPDRIVETRRRQRLVVTGMSTLTALVLLFGYHTSTGSGTVASTVAVGTEVAGASSTGASSTASSSTVTGDAASTRWGPVQVRITYSGSTITAVDVVQQPSGNGRDEEINAQAVPELVAETLSAQDADIDVVSGATVTSEGYLQSLQSALDRAGL